MEDLRMANYKPRVIDEAIANRLRNKGAILVEGAKWCGKTTTCEQHAASILYMSDPDRMKQNLQLADISPRSLLQGEKAVTLPVLRAYRIYYSIVSPVRPGVNRFPGKGPQGLPPEISSGRKRSSSTVTPRALTDSRSRTQAPGSSRRAAGAVHRWRQTRFSRPRAKRRR